MRYHCCRYHYCTFYDGIEICHSEYIRGYVIVHFEQPDKKFGFKTMQCRIPDYRIRRVVGFKRQEVARLVQFTKNNTDLIIAGAKAGGIKKVKV